MLTPPDDLSHDQLHDALVAGWGLQAAEIGYAPVGFGSHHWLITDDCDRRWFLTADAIADSAPQARALRAAMATGHALRHRAGLQFVIAPQKRPNEELTIAVGCYLAALFPYLDREFEGAEADPTQRVEMIAAVHAATQAVSSVAPVEDFVIMDRASISTALDPTVEPADGPYGVAFADLLDQHRIPLQRALAAYDQLASELATDRSRWVVTHGEPKADNTMITEHGPVLIDWDTARLAPPERDVWMTGGEDVYTRKSGRPIDQRLIDFYRLRWDLDDLSSFGTWFVADHQATADTKIGWDASVSICAKLAESFG
jgi:spectinomycin phosphotransferase